jgi:hypothetical protein
MTRMAGQLALIGTLGSGAAFAADGIAHSPMDRAAENYKGFKEIYEKAPPMVQNAYVQVFGQGAMSNMDRMIAGAILSGTIPPSQGAGRPKADSPEGVAAIEMAEQIRQQAPELGKALGALANQEMELFAQQAIMRSQGQDVTSQSVVAAAEQGAGVSPLPAVLAGTGVGGGAALLGSLLARRGGKDPFRVP